MILFAQEGKGTGLGQKLERQAELWIFSGLTLNCLYIFTQKMGAF